MTIQKSYLFNKKSYINLIKSFIKLGYEIKDFDSVIPTRRHLILRHDIDMSINAARDLAFLEKENSMKSTYFVLMNSEFYNVFAPDSIKLLNEIKSYGHKIGLHFDASVYSQNTWKNNIKRELSSLKNIIGECTNIISFHRPTKGLFDLKKKIGGISHTYESRFVSDMGYISDSRGGWHYGHPLSHPSIIKGAAIQLLTHPIWWITKGKSSKEKLNNFLKEKYVFIDSELAKQCSIHVAEKFI